MLLRCQSSVFSLWYSEFNVLGEMNFLKEKFKRKSFSEEECPYVEKYKQASFY